MDQRTKGLVERLKDARSKKVAFVSHCILNENTRYLGGAFRKSCVSEVLSALQKQDIGIVQMKCPEQKAWGGVLKRHLLLVYGCKNSFPIAYKLRGPLVSIFRFYTRLDYGRIAREVASEIEDYVDSGFQVVGIIGVGGSPSCGVSTSLDLKKSFELVASLDLGSLERDDINRQMYQDCLVDGKGLFVEALEKELKKRGLKLDFLEHSLVSEWKGKKTKLAF